MTENLPQPQPLQWYRFKDSRSSASVKFLKLCELCVFTRLLSLNICKHVFLLQFIILLSAGLAPSFVTRFLQSGHSYCVFFGRSCDVGTTLLHVVMVFFSKREARYFGLLCFDARRCV